MNQTNISSSNSRIPTFIAMALTASTISSPSAIHDVNVPHPYYIVDAQNNIAKISNYHTVSNIQITNRNQDNDLENFRLIKDLGERLVNRSKDIDSQIAKIVDDNFWDLI